MADMVEEGVVPLSFVVVVVGPSLFEVEEVACSIVEHMMADMMGEGVVPSSFEVGEVACSIVVHMKVGS